MGNIPPRFSPNESDVPNPDTNSDTVDVALICEQDYYDEHSGSYHRIREDMYMNTKLPAVKKRVREFIHNTYGYDKICRWTTWDRTNADILPYHLENNGLRNLFDVICAIGCPIILFSQEDVNHMCRLLRPNGLLLIVTKRDIGQDSAMEMAMRLSYNDIPNCQENRFVPISRFAIGERGSIEVWKRDVN